MIKNVKLVGGKLEVTHDNGNVQHWDIKEYLQSADVPDLTISSLSLVTSLAQVVMVLVRTLQDLGVISEETFADGFDYEYIRSVLIDDLSAEEVA